MLVARSMDPGWLSNTYLVADERGGTALFVDSGAPVIVWSPDSDRKGKAWVRFDDGTDALAGGSRVERS